MNLGSIFNIDMMGAILNVYHYQKSQKMVIKMADNMKANQKWWPKVSSTWTRILNVFQWLVHYDHRWVQCYPTSHQSEIVHSSIYFWWKIQCTFRASARNAPWCHNRPLETFGGVVRQSHTLTWSSSRTSQWMKCASPGPEASSFTANCCPSSSEKSPEVYRS